MRFRGQEPEDDDDSLIDWVETPNLAAEPIMVVGVPGFMDAGSAVGLAVEHILKVTENRLLATFDIDLLFDYRGRRPFMTYLTNHFSDIDLPSLTLVECKDERGVPFLLLSGTEPDLGWMTLVDTLVELVEDLGIVLTAGMQAFPFRTPHTRPVHITAHATDLRMVADRKPWVGNMQVPGSLSNYLELQLGQEGHRAIGFAAHVPEYLATAEHPRSALALLAEVQVATGLVFDLSELKQDADKSDANWTSQLQSNSEGRALVEALEEQYDDAVSRQSETPVEVVPDGEIAAELEKFREELEAWGKEQGKEHE